MGRKLIRVFLVSVLPIFFITGCSDFVEVQDRNFVLAMGISQTEGKYETVFGSPDFGNDTKEKGTGDDKHIRTYASSYLGEIEDLYNASSDKRLDFRHLEVIVLDKSICKNKDMLEELIHYLKGNYEISRNALLFYYSGDVKDVFEMGGSLGSSIGDYIKKLDNNIRGKFGIKPITIGDLMRAFSQEQALIVPILAVSEESIKVSGGAAFYDGEIQRELDETEYLLYLTAKGEGDGYTIYIMDSIPVVLKKIDSSFSFEYKEGVPAFFLKLTIDAERVDSEKGIRDETLSLAVSDYLNNALTDWFQSCIKQDKLDLLKLYDWSALKNKQIWIDYSGRSEDFINDLSMTVLVESRMR